MQKTLRRSCTQFVAVSPLPSRSLQPDADRPPSQVADAGAFDLDHLGSHVGGERGGKRFGDQGAARDDFHPLQRSKCLGYKGFLRHHDLLPF